MTTAKICEVDGCGNTALKRCMCNRHYLRWYKTGDPNGGGTSKIKFDPDVKCMADGCGEVAKINGLCKRHYSKRYRLGSTDAGRQRIPVSGKITRAWLLENSGHRGEDCLIWPFGRTSKGYGILPAEGQLSPVSAHREMCILVHGNPENPKLQARHSCGKGHLGCVNPSHLQWGTGKQNMADAMTHGTTLRGSKNAKAKLNEDQVMRIYGEPERRGVSVALARQFGVDVTTIRYIRNGRLWSWLTAHKSTLPV